jgi:phage shock protein PspC (stress-responsive transcriptional regulator)
VGSGVADFLGTDMTATRVGLAAAAVLGHVAIPAYAAAWALIPEEGKTRPRAAEWADTVGEHVDSLIARVRRA